MRTQASFHVPSNKNRRRVPIKTIRAIARHIAEKFDPEEIILFGSHAYGKPTAESDVDLLVVMDTPRGEMDAMVEIAKSLPILNFGVDVIVHGQRSKSARNWVTGFCVR